MSAPAESAAVLDALVDLIASRVAARLAVAPAANDDGASASGFYTGASPPPGLSKRTFLHAARDGNFPSFKRGKVVYARRADVHAWIERGAPAGASTRPDQSRVDAAAVKLMAGRR